MTEHEEHRALLARIAAHDGMADMDLSRETLDELRWLAPALDRAAAVVRQKGRMAAMCYGVPHEDEERSSGASEPQRADRDA